MLAISRIVGETMIVLIAAGQQPTLSLDPLAPVAAGVDDVEPGALDARDSTLLYGAAQGALELLEVQPAGGRPMAAAEWLRGHRA